MNVKSFLKLKNYIFSLLYDKNVVFEFLIVAKIHLLLKKSGLFCKRRWYIFSYFIARWICSFLTKKIFFLFSRPCFKIFVLPILPNLCYIRRILKQNNKNTLLNAPYFLKILLTNHGITFIMNKKQKRKISI